MLKIYIGIEEVYAKVDDLNVAQALNYPEDVSVTVQVSDPNNNDGLYDISIEDLIDKAGLK